MSNRINLIRTKFTDSSGEYNGFRIYDDYGSEYGMFADEAKPSDDDKEFLLQVKDNFTRQVTDMVGFGSENGMYIDDEFYDGEEIAKMLNK